MMGNHSASLDVRDRVSRYMKPFGQLDLGYVCIDSGGRDDDTKCPVPAYQVLIRLMICMCY